MHTGMEEFSSSLYTINNEVKVNVVAKKEKKVVLLCINIWRISMFPMALLELVNGIHQIAGMGMCFGFR